MSAEEADETQSAFGDGGGGPGAPTPLSVLEVRRSNVLSIIRTADGHIRV